MPPEATAVSAAPPHFAARMRLFYGGFLLVGGVTVPFFPIWLQSRGLSPVEIANIIALPALVRVFLTPFAGFYADHAPSRRFATISFTVPALLIFPLAWMSTGFLPILLITGLSLTFYGLAQPPAEALALTGVRRFGLDYGRMRMIGSMAFIVANLSSGALISVLSGNDNAISGRSSSRSPARRRLSFALPKTPPAIRAADDAAQATRWSSLRVFANAGLVLLIFASALEQASQGMLNGFGSIHWKALQFSEIQIGSLWAVGIVSEVTVFLFSRIGIRRFGPYWMLGAGMVASMVRWAPFPSPTTSGNSAFCRRCTALPSPPPMRGRRASSRASCRSARRPRCKACSRCSPARCKPPSPQPAARSIRQSASTDSSPWCRSRCWRWGCWRRAGASPCSR